MSQDSTSQIPKSIPSPLNVVIGGAGIGLLLAAAAFAASKSRRGNDNDFASRFHPTRSQAGLASGFKGSGL